MTRKDFETKSLEELCVQLEDEGADITTYDTLKDFAKRNIDEDNFFLTQHICEALNEKQAEFYIYDYSMGTMETPTPIESKDDIEHLIDED